MIKIYKTIFSFMVMIIIPIWLLIFTLIQELNDYLLFLIPLWILTIVINNFFNKRKTTSEYGFSVEDYSKKLDMAKALQQALLSIKVPDIEGVNIAAECIPAQHLGGDFLPYHKVKVENLVEIAPKKELLHILTKKIILVSQ